MALRPLEPGQKFGRLTLVARVAARNLRWECLCECGSRHLVYAGNLRSGRVSSCGCRRSEIWSSRRKDRTYQAGYAFVLRPNHPRANPHTGRVREHILVMETK